VIVVVSHIVFMFQGDSAFTDVIPGWKYLLFGITLFVYQHLDNLDGKQARKTSKFLMR
jgi:phosphatidylglycerophosphate synthase